MILCFFWARKRKMKYFYGKTPTIFYLYFNSGFRMAQWNFKSFRSLFETNKNGIIRWRKKQQSGNKQKAKQQKRIPRHLAERLIGHLFAVVSPLPFIFFPVEAATDPDVGIPLAPRLTVQIFAQKSIFLLDRFSQAAVSIFAFEMCIQPIHSILWYKITFVTDANKMWWT